jgi:hypothetical protein
MVHLQHNIGVCHVQMVLEVVRAALCNEIIDMTNMGSLREWTWQTKPNLEKRS